jgi:hypothetical protein
MSRNIKAVSLLICFLFSGGLLFSGGEKDEAKEIPVQMYDSGYYHTAADGQEVVISGTVRLVGSAPFPRYVFTEAEKYDWHISNLEDVKKISSFEQQSLTIKGIVVLREVILANGKHLGTERILKSISIVE